MDAQWTALKAKLEKILGGSSGADLFADVDEYVERLGLQTHRLEDHLKASEAEIKSLKAATTTMERLVQERVKGDDPVVGKLPFHPVSAPSKHSVEELVEQLARVKQENDDMVKQKNTNEKFYNAEIEKLCRFKATIQEHTESLSMQVRVESDSVRRERDDLLFQNADDELNKAKLQSRLDDALIQLRELAELTEEQAIAIEWLKVHRPDSEAADRPEILDNTIYEDEDDGEDESQGDGSASFADAKSDVHREKSAGLESSPEDEGRVAEVKDPPCAPGDVSSWRCDAKLVSAPGDIPKVAETGDAQSAGADAGRKNPRTFKGRKYVQDAQRSSEDQYGAMEPSSPTQLAQRRQEQ